MALFKRRTEAVPAWSPFAEADDWRAFAEVDLRRPGVPRLRPAALFALALENARAEPGLELEAWLDGAEFHFAPTEEFRATMERWD